MRKTIGSVFGLLVVFFCIPNFVSAATIIPYDTVISGHETWTAAESPYLVSNVFVPAGASLTLAPGTIIKGVNSLSIQGTLTVGASDAAPVIFTSAADDTFGGDTNGDGNATAPVLAGDWSGIAVSGSGNATITNTHFLYGGFANRSVIIASGLSTVSVSQSEFRYGNNGITLSGGTVNVFENTFQNVRQYGIRETNGTLNFGRNIFSSVGVRSVSLERGSVKNEGGNTGGGGIYFFNNTLVADTILPKDGLSYVFYNVVVPTGKSLSIEPGAVLKMWNSTKPLISQGTLTMGSLDVNAEPVIVTSFSDDTVGGDTNNNGDIPLTSGGWGTIILSSGTASIENAVFRYGGNSIYAVFHNMAAETFITKSRFEHNGTGIIVTGGSVTLTNSELSDGNIGLKYHSGIVTLTKNSIRGNSDFGILNISSTNTTIDARDTWWGGENGPYHSILNPGGIGNNTVSDNVLFEPWSACFRDTCHSNVLFLPGIMGSRLYETNNGDEDELWFSSVGNRQERLTMNADGTSKNDVYTKDDRKRDNWEIDENGLLDDVHGNNLYQSFLDDLRGWKEEGVFADYAFIPYDWRLSPNDVVMNGKVINGQLSYINHQANLTESYLYQQAKTLQATSHSGKLTLIGHSNGGLVIKAFVQKLKETNDPLFFQIDQVIFVGVPQNGTPDSIVSLLYGSKIGILWFGISQSMTRTLGHFMPSMYHLLPSEKLFEHVVSLIEFVGNNIDPALTERYGNKINTFAELHDFLLGKEGRSRPEEWDMYKPEVLDETLLTQAENTHAVLDTWTPAPETKVIQIAGWGLYTVSGLKVTDTKLCQFNENQLVDGRPVCEDNRIESVTLRDVLTLNGDGTVLVPSALALDEGNTVKRYWVDLREYNKAISSGGILSNVDREHKNILEVDTLRPFIKSLIENSGINFQYISGDEPIAPSNVQYIKYEIHSPLHLTATDTEGKKIGWDSETNTIVENIQGAQYFETGEVKTLLIPKDLEHTVKLAAYAHGSFTLKIDELDGEAVVNETTFEAIPALANSTVDVLPASESGPIQMNIDFDGNGTVETSLETNSGTETGYENPAPPDITPPEISVTFDQDTQDVVWRAKDDRDQNPILVITHTEAMATDASGNVTHLPFIKYREHNTRLTVQFEKVVYNEEEVSVPKTTLVYDWQLKQDVLTDLDTNLHLKSVSRLKAEYHKKHNETKITEKDKKEETSIVTVRPGLVSIHVGTQTGSIIWEY